MHFFFERNPEYDNKKVCKFIPCGSAGCLGIYCLDCIEENQYSGRGFLSCSICYRPLGNVRTHNLVQQQVYLLDVYSELGSLYNDYTKRFLDQLPLAT